MKTDSPSAPDGLAVFVLALAWTAFGGDFLGSRLGPWATPAFSLGLALVPLAACAALRFDVVRTFSLSRAAPSRFAAGLVLASGLLIASVVSSVLIARWFPDLPITERSLRTDVYDSGFAYLVATVALVPALCEELLFRGFILTSFARLRRPIAIFATGALFGFLHLDAAQLPMTALVGMALSWVCLETGSVFVPASMHAFHNMALLLIVRFAPELVPDDPVSVLAYAAVAMALICAGFALFRKPSRAANKAVY